MSLFVRKNNGIKSRKLTNITKTIWTGRRIMRFSLITILSGTDRIFVAAHELIKHFGGLLNVRLTSNRVKVNLYDGIKIEVNRN